MRFGLALWALVVGCDTPYVVAHQPGPDAGAMCSASAESETSCSDQVDEDCDGYVDCLDPDCDDTTCGDGLSCVAGACLACADGLCAAPLPRIDDVHIDVRGDTAVIDFAGVLGAVDYRIYPMPAAEDVTIGPDGSQTIANAIYRCAGDRPTQDRALHPGGIFDRALNADQSGYARSEAEATLGYVYLRAGPGRVPVYRLADPDGPGGYLNAEFLPALYAEANAAEYVTDPARRAELLAAGWRDDGIAFFVPEDGDRVVYRASYPTDPIQGERVVFFFTEGPELEARRTNASELGERFSIASTPGPDRVALHRVTYYTGSTFDVLPAGDVAHERALHQTGPVTSLTWTGLTEPTVLVLEALDAGCPFPSAFIGGFDAPIATDPVGPVIGAPTVTLDEARSSTGEVFVNGQHDPTSRPRPIARSFVAVAPEPPPAMDFYSSFTDPTELAGLEESTHPFARLYRNRRWAIDTAYCGDDLTFGPVLGELFVGFSNCNVSVVPRVIQPRIEADRFLHVRMSVDVVSTRRRWPQILITNAPMVEVADVPEVSNVPVINRLGPVTASELPGLYSSLIVQPHASHHELQVQFCDQRGWGVSTFCPRANLYGEHAGEVDPLWGEPWAPVPVLGDLAAFDRPVQIDVYASTERVFVFLDERPAGCAVLPAGRMPSGDVTVAFVASLWEAHSDTEVTDTPGGRAYERTRSVHHSDRRLDDLGIDVGVPIPAWDERTLPCGRRWYGGSLLE